MTRTVNLNLSDEDMTQISETIGSRDKLQAAIGYLATWNTNYPVCKIFRDGETDLGALYCNDKGERAYVIGAVWHETHYGFHS
jgi:hypothetical protein